MGLYYSQQSYLNQHYHKPAAADEYTADTRPRNACDDVCGGVYSNDDLIGETYMLPV